ncbi:hypothetical protein SERLADRAFT_364517 [Serpula lacrymans var. lacrymans S7.9]|uniref:Uncharacterized protein n=1 Tax=Serpula lacrymans var. lacrymans (strain S7.9) TaxID=578457 RepID=F8NEC8_SERL9|nr:uncharacterized protein SERLADRAFT_364517 [Serpula lacrymans var. lacrymans S7.9]EGO30562.1 hypothetical protein SERLADRAFT_364517 [Serpula lacrymans var. lacrymans S7.9]
MHHLSFLNTTQLQHQNLTQNKTEQDAIQDATEKDVDIEDTATQDEDEDQMYDEDIEPVQNGDEDIPPHEERPDPEFEYHLFINDDYSVFLLFQSLIIYSGEPPIPLRNPSKDNWTLYCDCIEFEAAELLYKKTQVSSGDINTLMDFWHASFIKNGLQEDCVPFASADDLYRTIDPPSLGDIHWQSFMFAYNSKLPDTDIPDWMTKSYEVWFCSPHAIIRNILSNPDSAGWFDYRPIYANTYGSMFIPIILGSDKTTVSAATGQNRFYPIYISIGNVHNSAHQAHRNAVALLGFLSIPKTAKKYTNNPRQVIYGLGPYIADYPEQVLLVYIVQGWCPQCISMTDNLDVSRPFTNDFPCADIHEILSPDLLHQIIKGTFKDHLVLYVDKYLVLTHGRKCADQILDDIDSCIAAALSYPGLRRFPQGCGYKQWTGDDSKVLMKVSLPALVGHVPDGIFRAPNGLCLSITEAKHIKAVKEPSKCSSCYEALRQMLTTNQRFNKLAASCVDFTSRGMLEDDILTYALANADLELEGTSGQPRCSPSYDVPLRGCPRLSPNTKISVVHSATIYFHTPSDKSGVYGMHREVICITPMWQKGLDVVCVLLLFSFSYRGVCYPCALVQCFFHIADECDELTGMWIVHPDYNEDGSPTLQVIHTDCIIEALIGKDINCDNSLDSFDSFYVNKFIDHNAFKITF